MLAASKWRGGGGRRPLPTEALRRRVMVARRGCSVVWAIVVKIDRSLGVLAVDDDDADDGKKPTALGYKRQSHAQSFIILELLSEASSSSVI